jgi:hypothetical protein
MNAMDTDLEFAKLVDEIVASYAEIGARQEPPEVARMIAAMLCKGFAERMQREYLAQIESIVRERTWLFLAAAERAKVDAGQN